MHCNASCSAGTRIAQQYTGRPVAAAVIRSAAVGTLRIAVRPHPRKGWSHIGPHLCMGVAIRPHPRLARTSLFLLLPMKISQNMRSTQSVRVLFWPSWLAWQKQRLMGGSNATQNMSLCGATSAGCLQWCAQGPSGCKCAQYHACLKNEKASRTKIFKKDLLLTFVTIPLSIINRRSRKSCEIIHL